VSLPLLQTALLLPLETLVNGLLAMDAAAPARLARLEGSLLGIHGTAPEVHLYLRVTRGRLRLSALSEDAPQASLHGPVSALLGLLLRRESVHSLADSGVELRGSASVLRELQALLLDLDIDWEYHLGRLTGDLPAGLVGRGVGAGREALRKGTASARATVDDYLVHESGLFASRDEVAELAADSLELRLALDRLEARLHHLATAAKR
jgi:ubiquinone biosynthesis protein UbiJ